MIYKIQFNKTIKKEIREESTNNKSKDIIWNNYQ